LSANIVDLYDLKQRKSPKNARVCAFLAKKAQR